MSQANNATLTRFPQDLSRALSRRGKDLLEAPNLPQAVNALSPLEAYYIVKEVGLEDATSLLLNASRTQIQTFIDLDCWSQDLPDPLDLEAWLAPFAALGKDALRLAFTALDLEIQTLYLLETLDIFEHDPEEPGGSGRDVPTKVTADSLFHLEKRHPTDERELDPFFVIDAIYSAGLEKPHALIMAALWESRSELQERAYQFRSGRLQDLGFPPPNEAMRIFAAPLATPPGVHLSKWSTLPSTLPAIYAQPLNSPSLVGRALQAVQSEELLSSIENDLIYLTNAAVIAYGQSPNDLKYTGEIATRVIHLLSLGLEVLLSEEHPLDHLKDPTIAHQAAGLLRKWPLQEIFRHGHRATEPLRREAHRLRNDPVVQSWLNLAPGDDDYSSDRLDREFLAALCSSRPLYAGRNPLSPSEAKAFETQVELLQAEERLNDLAGRLL